MRKRRGINSVGISSILATVILVCYCQQAENRKNKNANPDNLAPSTPLIIFDTVGSTVVKKQPDSSDNRVKRPIPYEGVVDIATLSRDIIIDLKYSQEDNFLGEDLYGDLDECYLREKPAQMLVEAQRLLSEMKPGYSIIVYDCLRPRHVQRQMWDHVKGTSQQKYVANPDRISMHNYGAAVDVSMVDEKGDALDMGSDFDYFGDLSQPRLEKTLLKQGKLTKKHIENRMLLRGIMKKAGFRAIRSEWWHFNAGKKEDIRRDYEVVE